MVPHWILYEQEAVHAEPNHKEYGGVKIYMQDVAVDNTNIEIALFFVIWIKVAEAWQCGEENKVWNRKTEEVNIAALPLL